MTAIAYVSLNNKQIVEVDVDPSVFPGVMADPGAVALMAAGGTYRAWQKIGVLDTDWAALNPGAKRGYAQIADFSLQGGVQKAQVTFGRRFATAAYVVSISGTADRRQWSYESVLPTGFVINANAASLISGVVGWEASLQEETS
jgi:hypothetical protein